MYWCFSSKFTLFFSWECVCKEKMSVSSSREGNKDEQEAQSEACKPRWLEDFLENTFFDSCTAHPCRRNELNKYCINCNMSLCQYCVSSGPHRHHKILKIYRHVYKDVVSLAAMEKYVDCSQIQPYKCNKRLVISLNPLPHCGSALNNEATCNICSRKLTEPDLYRYCSISCKVKAFLRKPDDSVPPFISIQSPPQEKQEETSPPFISIKSPPQETQDETSAFIPIKFPPEETQEETSPFISIQSPPQETQEVTSEPPKRKRKRKGTPRRAPFF
ncbi:protein RGF1 INDUCIBLE TRANSCRIPTION FACTOR 1-like [Gastrolobium bilobum]|uniref:protein RGF1 INDUCIBLE TRANSCRIPTION FACTOR 1-like n=1 Tax=Gastrolobium bilobum TaxID=150636 RepID=UPI002AAF352B|nr:protein RGF1 INDUCIBLE TRANSCRIPTION FACTOR 1-like [Gastrolobium bilobum]